MRGRVVKGIGLALVAAPEPFTTPLGIGLLAASWVISRAEEARKRARLRHMITEYVRVYRPFGHELSVETGPVVEHHVWELRSSPSVESRVRGNGPMRSRSAAYPPRRDQKVVHHTLDPDRVLRLVGTRGTKGTSEDSWEARGTLDVKVTHHTIKRDLAVSPARN